MKGSPGRSLSSSTKALSCISSPKVSCFSNFFGSTASLFSEEVSEEGWGEGEDLEDDERGEDECWADGVEEGGADFAIADLSVTSGRNEAVQFSIPWMNLGKVEGEQKKVHKFGAL